MNQHDGKPLVIRGTVDNALAGAFRAVFGWDPIHDCVPPRTKFFVRGKFATEAYKVNQYGRKLKFNVDC